MELVRFPTEIRFRRGQMAELSPRASLLYLAFLPLVKFLLYPAFLLPVKCLLRRREYLVFHVSCHLESDADSSLLWRADWAICPAKLFPPGTL